MNIDHRLTVCLIAITGIFSLTSDHASSEESDIAPIKFHLERKKRDGTAISRLPAGPVGTIATVDGTPVFGLEYLSHRYFIGRAQQEPGPLARELVRQALLIAAREHLGCRTRDVLLGEALPKNPLKNLGRVGIVSVTDWPLGKKKYLVFGLAVYQEKQNERQFLLEKNYKIEGKEYDILSQIGEKMADASRNEFPALLKKLGVPHRPISKPQFAKIPESLTKDAYQLNYLTQYQMIRGLHQFLDEKGPNWQAYLQLAQAYGHLGVLTEYYWSDFSSVCKARGMLYALRAKGLSSEKPSEYEAFAKTHLGTNAPGQSISQATVLLAYLQAIYGRHADAAQTLAEYEKAVSAGRWKPAKGMQAPLYYAKAISAYDLDALRKPAETDAPHLGPFYLAAIYEATGLSSQTLKNYFIAEKQNPECLRLSDALIMGRTVGHMRIASETLRQKTGSQLVKKAGELSKVSPDLKSTIYEYEQKASPLVELRSRNELITQLRQLGADKEIKREFNSAVLGQMLLERSFTNATASIDTLRHYLGLDASDLIRYYEFICRTHPFRDYIQLQQTNSKLAIAMLAQANQTMPSRPAPAFRHKQLMMPMVNIGLQMAQLPVMSSMSRMNQVDHTYSSLLALRQFADQYFVPSLLEGMEKISPKSEAAPLSVIEAKSTTPEELQEVEKQNSDSVFVLASLVKRYDFKDRYEKKDKAPKTEQENIKRVLEQLVKISDDDFYLSQLAYLYQNQEQEKEWVALSKKMLELPIQSLNTVHWEIQLAYWYARQNDQENALKHAEHAFRSRSGNSYNCLVNIQTKYGKYDDANKVLALMTDHYKSAALQWLSWCIAHNTGDEQTAKSKADAYFKSVDADNVPGYQGRLFHYYMITGDPIKAAAALMKIPALSRTSPATLLMGTCVTDQTGDKGGRDRLLQTVIDLEKNSRKAADSAVWIAFAKKLQIFLKRPDKRKLTHKMIVDLTEKEKFHVRQHLELVAAYYLVINNFSNEAAPMLDSSAIINTDFPLTVNIISRQILRKQGKKVGPKNQGLKVNIPKRVEKPNQRDVGKKESVNSIGMKFQRIPAGKFQMGASFQTKKNNEKPVHQVILTKPFEMGVYEVTQQQYEKVMGTNPSAFKGPNHPVESVNWNDAVEFCRKLSEMPGEKGFSYRLPTEAEWEYACRAGTTTKYSFGDDYSKLGDYAWYFKNSGFKIHPAGEKKPNSFGLYDMHGNVFEWCQDWFDVYPSGMIKDPLQTKGRMKYRVIRGGGVTNVASYCYSSARHNSAPDLSNSRFGFRVVRISD